MSNPVFTLPDFGEDTKRYIMLADELATHGDLHSAATAYDHAFGLAPNNAAIRAARQNLLNQLSVFENGILFRYIPSGTFLMGSENGDPDERPVHSVSVTKFWIAETPLSWATFCDIMDCEPPPKGRPREMAHFHYETATEAERERYWNFVAGERIRLQYCEDETLRASDWHAHDPNASWNQGGNTMTSRELFGEVLRANPDRPWGYDQKPMVAVSWELAESCCQTLSTPEITYSLPTEAQWEKAARGGLIGKQYPWGDEPPNADNCDFDRFEQFSIQQSRQFAPNDYGLYAMCGGVWEWTTDWYDAEYYARSPKINPAGIAEGTERVLRGGSWTDCADAVRVSFRMSMGDECEQTANIGFRMCRTLTANGIS